jgi:hypothetical protein
MLATRTPSSTTSRWRRRAAAACFCLLMHSMSSAQAARTLAHPPSSQIASAGERMKVNGVDMTVEHFDSALPADDILAFYREQWRGDTPGDHVTEHRTSQWHVIGRQARNQHQTVQVRPRADGGSEGFLASSDTRSAPRSPSQTPIHLPMGATIVSVVQSSEAGRNATITVAKSGASVAFAERWLRGSAKLRGFEVDPLFDSARPAEQREHALFMRRGDDELTAILQPYMNGSMIVLHHVYSEVNSR